MCHCFENPRQTRQAISLAILDILAMARHWQSARPVETLSVMQQDMKLQLSTICMQELVDRVRSRLQAAAAALLTGDQQKPQPAANGIASGLPQHQHAAVTAVALALARLQQLDSGSADASSASGGGRARARTCRR